jgi:hypothetical protein
MIARDDMAQRNNPASRSRQHRADGDPYPGASSPAGAEYRISHTIAGHFRWCHMINKKPSRHAGRLAGRTIESINLVFFLAAKRIPLGAGGVSAKKT